MNLTAEQLEKNFQKLLKIIEVTMGASPEKRDLILKLHNDWADRIATAPASSKKSYHNAFPGGYVLHVLNVIRASFKILDAWKAVGYEQDFSDEELFVVALCHDLGKIGNESFDYYVPCQEQWLLKKGQNYVINPQLQYMKVAERSLMVLHNRGIKLSEKEYLGIRLHDGLYEDANKAYLMSYNEDFELRTMLPHIVHQADLMSGKIEELSSKKNKL